jgi:phage gp45-like
MALSKEVKCDKYEIVSDFKHIQCRTATIVKEDGVELSRSFHRRVLTPEMDVSGESDEIKGMATALWTDAIKEAWADFQEASSP